GIKASVFAHEPNAIDVELRNLLGELGRHTALDVHELAVRVLVQLRGELSTVRAYYRRETPDVGRADVRLRRIQPRRHNRRTDRERFAVAIEDDSSIGGQRFNTQRTGVTLFLEKGPFGDVQIHHSHTKTDGKDNERRDDRHMPPTTHCDTRST